MSYALGMDIVSWLVRDGVDIDMNAVVAGLEDMQAGRPALTREQQKAVMAEMQKDIAAREEAKKKVAGAENLKIGKAFFEQNAKKEGIAVLEATASDGTKAEVQYQVLISGTGPSPKAGDVLKVHYEGRLLDGRVFDSSLQRGEPFNGRAGDFIAGWVEPLLKMKVGDKWRLFVPPSLGYGEFVPYNIGPCSTLIYDLELLAIEPGPSD